MTNKQWYKGGWESNGEYHLSNITKNPVIDIGGNKYWYNSEWELHREDGPACEYADGSKQWWINGKCHRDDGPAVEHPDGIKSWYIKGDPITVEVNQWIKDNNFPDYKDWDDKTKILFKLKFG